MAVLVTRPAPDHDKTARSLNARGLEAVVAPMLRFEPVPLPADLGDEFGAVIITSSNALRAVAPQLAGSGLLRRPLFAVGDKTANAARESGFTKVISADGDAGDLIEVIAAGVKKRIFKKSAVLLYLAAADVARDLAGDLVSRGFQVTTQTAYRMAPSGSLPREVCDAFAAHGIEAVLHYSRRSAEAFVAAARAGGVEISALAVPQCCISQQVAGVLREAGANQVTVAERPDENSLLEGLTRALRN